MKHTLASLFLASTAFAGFDPDNSFWSMPLDGFFLGQTKGGKPKRLNVYLVRRDGQWIAGVGTATVDGHAIWNTALMLVEPRVLKVDGNKLTGPMTITLVPDPWQPHDQKVRVATVTMAGTVAPSTNANETGSISGTWKATIPGDAAELEAAGLGSSAAGDFRGGLGGASVPDIADVSYDLALYAFMPGQTADNFQRRRALSLGFKDGKPVSARLGQMDIRHRAYDYQLLETPTGITLTPDTITGTVAFDAQTLDGDQQHFSLTLAGKRVANWVAGTWHSNGRSGFFRGNVNKGAYVPETTAADHRPWFVPVAGYQPVAAGEHPRLFFRQSDLAELRRRAETPEGKIIIKRLRELLNGSDGETMPTLFNPATKAYADNHFKAVAGAYSISHGAGFGFLYQLTGDKKYAELARQCVEKAFAGQRNLDDRYAWVAPGGELRAGPSIGWTAVAYDLCYDAWPEDYRRKVALAIQNYADEKGGEWNNPEGITLRKMALTPKQGPGSNHYGAVCGGAGLAVLAILGDPGTDSELLGKYIDALERNVVRHLSAGWGDGGYYNEGWGASRVGTQGGFLCFLQAVRTARGHDYLNVERPNASYITMVPRCLMVLGPPGYFPYRSNMGPTYGSPEIGSQLDGFSSGGYFSEGFGAIADKYKPGLLWTHDHIFRDDVFDMVSPYPHRAMLALINWPFGVAEKNPAKVMPLATRDTLYDYFVWRNRFQDANDIVTTVLIKQPEGTKPRTVMVWGLGGLRLDFGEPPRNVKVTQWDGRSLSVPGYALAVDYSKASGADALIVSVGNDVKPPAESPKVKFTKAGQFNVLTLSASGQHPEIRTEADGLVIGKQKVRFVNGNLNFETFARDDAQR